MNENKTKLALVLSILLSYVNYFLIGSAIRIRAYGVDFSIPRLKLFFGHGVLLGILIAINFYILKKILSSGRMLMLAVVTSVVSMYLSWHLCAAIAMRLGQPMYLIAGDYLRDIHGINWYYMDWGNWDIALLGFVAQVLNFFFFFTVSRLFRE